MSAWVQAITVIVGFATSVFAWVTSDSRKKDKLRKELNALEKKLRHAVAVNDDVATATIRIRMREIREELNNLT